MQSTRFTHSSSFVTLSRLPVTSILHDSKSQTATCPTLYLSSRMVILLECVKILNHPRLCQLNPSIVTWKLIASPHLTHLSPRSPAVSSRIDLDHTWTTISGHGFSFWLRAAAKTGDFQSPVHTGVLWLPCCNRQNFLIHSFRSLLSLPKSSFVASVKAFRLFRLLHCS